MNELLKSDFISRWKKYFQNAPMPIALFYSDELHNAEPAKKNASHHCMIADITKVFNGQSLAFNNDNISCGGGLRYCGYSDTLRPNFEFFLSYGIEGKMEGERYKKDPETVLELMKNAPKLKAPATWLIAKPFEKLNTDDNPEIILFFVTPDVLAGLFTLANFDRSDLYGVKVPFSAGCGSIIQYPLLENRSDNPDCILGMFDSSARPYVQAGTLSFAIPMKRFEKLVGFMDESFLTTGTWKVMEKRISGKKNR
ncbi:MAG: DUF169 domain-containing protein [Bacteroidales bacterium]|nr:DUF169 domain-containing protein [Bacteroidales bacterium]